MTRDVYLIRKILQKNWNVGDPNYVDGYAKEAITRHLELLREGGFVTEDNKLTWRGREFAATIGNDVVWDHLSEKFSVADLSAMPISILEGLASKLVAQWAENKFAA